MREKKSWRKTIDQEDLLQTLETQNREKEIQSKRENLKDSDLFKVNVAKGEGLKQKRDKLRRDRFREKEQKEKSHYEEEIVKKLIKKEENKKQQKQQQTNQKKKDEDEDELADIWNDGNGFNQSKTIEKFRNFKEKSTTKVKAVVVPLSGQSYNPSGKDHKEVIEKVV